MISSVIRLRGTVIVKVVETPGWSSSIWASASVIRSPTNWSSGSSAASTSSARVVIGALEMNGYRLIVDQATTSWLVTVPSISIGPCSGTYDGVIESMLTSSGVSTRAAARAGAESAEAVAGHVASSIGSPISSARARMNIGRRTTEASLTVGPVRSGRDRSHT